MRGTRREIPQGSGLKLQQNNLKLANTNDKINCKHPFSSIVEQ